MINCGADIRVLHEKGDKDLHRNTSKKRKRMTRRRRHPVFFLFLSAQFRTGHIPSLFFFFFVGILHILEDFLSFRLNFFSYIRRFNFKTSRSIFGRLFFPSVSILTTHSSSYQDMNRFSLERFSKYRQISLCEQKYLFQQN
jgi:hypothetical protein